MNVYDQAHALKAAIKESEEFKQYSLAKSKMEEQPELSEMLRDYQAKQFAIQGKQMMGENVTSEMMQQAQNLYQIMMKDPLAAEYLQCEMRFAVMMQDVYQLLGEVVSSGK